MNTKFQVLNFKFQKTHPKIFLALPVLNELAYIPHLISCIEKQTYKNFELYVCVNQPEDWWKNPEKKAICLDNQRTLEYLKSIKSFPTTIFDRSSKGSGWKANHYGVGWARKTVMDAISQVAKPDDILVTIDADTEIYPGYLEAVRHAITSNPDKIALSVPYYHKLTGDETTDRQILRYEIYMRYYALNMWRINNPYKFTAVGSAMALPVSSYRKIGGITPHKSGEDFYFMQKLRKSGEINHWCEEKVYPAARYSDRVFFGTGPAMIKGRGGDWSSYPIYDYRSFDLVEETFNLFSELFEKDIIIPMDSFIREIFKNKNIWQPLRENYKTAKQFASACEKKVDGLRILQFLKTNQKKEKSRDEENLIKFIQTFYRDEFKIPELEKTNFKSSDIEALNVLRNYLVCKEDELRVQKG
jgi:glycosyltransferase involved in cell wall biosynthesis